MTRPVCADCQTEMEPIGPTVTLGYNHNNAPVDYSRGRKYTCQGCQQSVYLPLGYAFQHTMGMGEPVDAVPVQPSAPAKQERKLP